MQRCKLLLATALLMAFALALAAQAHASYVLDAGIWERTDGDVNAIKFNIFCQSGSGFYMYKPGNNPGQVPGQELELFYNPSPPSPITIQGATVFFNQSGMDWIASYNTQTLNLGPAGLFGFYLLDLGTGTNGSITPVNIGTNMWKLQDPDTCIVVNVIDANPVPLPGAVWLLGSGLLGLVGVRKRFQN